jgi:hypothetical protein
MLNVLLLLSGNFVVKVHGLSGALMPSAWPGSWFCWKYASFFKILAKTMAWGCRGRMLQELQHSMLNLILMRSTIL